jgi:hypothetical protein
MTQRQLEREVASATGESVATIHRIGFNLVDPDFRDPLVIDWDQLDEERPRLFPLASARMMLD